MEELVEAREQLIFTIRSAMTDKDRAFLMSVRRMRPEWSLIELEGVNRLPAVKRKIKNLEGQPEKDRDADIRRLERVLEPVCENTSVL